MLKLMRAPAKYVQGEDALLELRQNVENLGKSFLFICSGSGRKATEDKIRQSFASSAASAPVGKSRKWAVWFRTRESMWSAA